MIGSCSPYCGAACEADVLPRWQDLQKLDEIHVFVRGLAGQGSPHAGAAIILSFHRSAFLRLAIVDWSYVALQVMQLLICPLPLARAHELRRRGIKSRVNGRMDFKLVFGPVVQTLHGKG